MVPICLRRATYGGPCFCVSISLCSVFVLLGFLANEPNVLNMLIVWVSVNNRERSCYLESKSLGLCQSSATSHVGDLGQVT